MTELKLCPCCGEPMEYCEDIRTLYDFWECPKCKHKEGE